MKETEKIQKINRNYGKPVTIEEITKKMSIFSRSWRLSFIILMIIDTCIVVAISALQNKLLPPVAGFALMSTASIINELAFVILTIVAWIYGTKLFKIIPPELELKLKKESKIIIFLVGYSALVYIFTSTIEGIFMIRRFLYLYPIGHLVSHFMIITNALLFNAFLFPFWKRFNVFPNKKPVVGLPSEPNSNVYTL